LGSYNRMIIIPYIYVFWSTGPFFLSDVARKYLKSHPNYEILLLSQKMQEEYCSHVGGRSWHKIDGTVINYFGDADQSKKPLGLVVVAIVLAIVLYKYFGKRIHSCCFRKHSRTV